MIQAHHVQIGEQKSSLDEWQKEARKLEMQGKQEQADQIRKDILQLLPVPWEILTYQKLQLLKKEAFLLESYNKKPKMPCLNTRRIREMC